MTKPVKKRYSPRLGEQYDSPAKDLMKRVYESHGADVHDVEDYGPDLIVIRGREIFYVEVEVKNRWSGDTFPYDTVQIPIRKRKYERPGYKLLFTIFNKEMTHFIEFDSEDVFNSPQKEVPNKFVYNGEFFFQVPVELGKVHAIEKFH